MSEEEPPDDNESYRTTKTSFLDILYTSSAEQLQSEFKNLSGRCTPLAKDGYLFMNLYATIQFEQGNRPPIINKKFVLDCFKIIGFCNKRPSDAGILRELKLFYAEHFAPLFQGGHIKHDLRNISHITPYIAQTMATAYSNNLKEHYISRLTKCLRILANEVFTREIKCQNNTKEYMKEYNKIKNHVIWQFTSAVISNELNKIPSLFKELFDRHRPYIIPRTFEKNVAYDCEVNPFNYMYPTLYICSLFEQRNRPIQEQIKILKLNNGSEKQIKELNKQLIKVFKPFPVRESCIPKYIRIDTASLIDYFEPSTRHLQEHIKECQQRIWNKYFNLRSKNFGFKRRPFKGHSFAYMIETDGHSVSILHMKDEDIIKKWALNDKKKKTRAENFGKTAEEKAVLDAKRKQLKELLKKTRATTATTIVPEQNNRKDILRYIDELTNGEMKDLFDGKHIVCGDPGKKFLLFLSDGINKLVYSRMQRDTESGARRNREILKHNKHMRGINKVEELLHDVTCRTANSSVLKEYIRIRYIVDLQVREEYEKPIYLKMAWRAQIGRWRNEDKFLDDIERVFGKKEDIILILGDHNNTNSLKNGPSTLGIGLKRLIAKRFTVFHINEFNTSQKCCNCWGNIESAEMKGKEIHRLVQCKNKDCYRRDFCWDQVDYPTCGVIGSESTETPKVLRNKYQVHNNFYTRDFNSCMCMLWIVHHMYYRSMKRPEQFSRNKKAEDELRQEVNDKLKEMIVPTKKLSFKLKKQPALVSLTNN